VTAEAFYRKGWLQFGYDTILHDWVEKALPSARVAVQSKNNAKWLRCGNTWFAGVNVLPNTVSGAVGDAGALQGVAMDFIRHALGISAVVLDRGQVSVCYPQYPQPMETESAAAFRYRRDRDAAHVDGLLPEGLKRRRFLREFHGFILGIPMTRFSRDCAPFVVWEGSHELVRAAFKARFQGIAPELWGGEDITETYQSIRQKVFECCKRVEVAVSPGHAFVIHRLAVHGTAPWGKTAVADADGRMICFFRPEIYGPRAWLRQP
jgi:hypothetical protein